MRHRIHAPNPAPVYGPHQQVTRAGCTTIPVGVPIVVVPARRRRPKSPVKARTGRVTPQHLAEAAYAADDCHRRRK